MYKWPLAEHIGVGQVITLGLGAEPQYIRS